MPKKFLLTHSLMRISALGSVNTLLIYTATVRTTLPAYATVGSPGCDEKTPWVCNR